MSTTTFVALMILLALQVYSQLTVDDNSGSCVLDVGPCSQRHQRRTEGRETAARGFPDHLCVEPAAVCCRWYANLIMWV